MESLNDSDSPKDSAFCSMIVSYKSFVTQIMTVLMGIGVFSVTSNILGMNLLMAAVIAFVMALICSWVLNCYTSHTSTSLTAPNLGIVNLDTRATGRPEPRLERRSKN